MHNITMVLRRFLLILVLVGVPVIASAEQATTQPTLVTGDVFMPSFKAVFELFILAVILESALAVVFNWKLFVTTLDTKATKPIIAVAVASLFVFTFHLDITTTLVNLYTGTSFPPGPGGQLLTALVIAGGSSGVNNLLQALGFRSVQQAPPPPAKPAPTEAWLAVGLRRQNAVGPVNVIAGPADSPKLIGVITGPGPRFSWLRFFVQDSARFPRSGGHSLTPGEYKVWLEGRDSAGKPAKSAEWGPYTIAAGSIVDVELTA
jgi:hypothetical protein